MLCCIFHISLIELHDVAMPAHHRGKHYGWELLHYISAVLEGKTVDDLKETKFFSLAVDESTDIALKKNLVLVAKYLSNVCMFHCISQNKLLISICNSHNTNQ